MPFHFVSSGILGLMQCGSFSSFARFVFIYPQAVYIRICRTLYAPKMYAFGRATMRAKTQLSVIDHNYNAERKGTGVYTKVWSKQLGAYALEFLWPTNSAIFAIYCSAQLVASAVRLWYIIDFTIIDHLIFIDSHLYLLPLNEEPGLAMHFSALQLVTLALDAFWFGFFAFVCSPERSPKHGAAAPDKMRAFSSWKQLNNTLPL